jgi:hypothetical protein
MARWALASGLALLVAQAGGEREPVPSFPPSPVGGVEGLPRLSSGLNSFGAIRGDGMAWPSFDINITAPLPGMRLIGMGVPIQVGKWDCTSICMLDVYENHNSALSK